MCIRDRVSDDKDILALLKEEYNLVGVVKRLAAVSYTHLDVYKRQVRDYANSVMPQCLAADQHGSLVQLLARFILATSVDVALISFSGPLIHPVKWNFADLSLSLIHI